MGDARQEVWSVMATGCISSTTTACTGSHRLYTAVRLKDHNKSGIEFADAPGLFGCVVFTLLYF